ncbi:MAG: hypothetical protein Kow00128_06810 [Deltaproteobacteria bacterium]
MNSVTVYQVDYARKTRVPIGRVRERRQTDRGDNLLGLLRLARKAFAATPQEALHIAVDGKEARRAWIRF